LSAGRFEPWEAGDRGIGASCTGTDGRTMRSRL
jgi:hypothetical protein